MAFISERLKERGFAVFLVPEVAKMTFHAGVKILQNDYSKENFARLIVNRATPAEYFQRVFVEREQIEMSLTAIKLEDYFTNLAERDSRPSVILCDRGLMDGKAYAEPEIWQMILDETGWNEPSLREKRYDGVLHLVTAADGAEESYNNEKQANSVDANVALWIDHNIRKAWNGHPIFRIIGNDESRFEGKIMNAWCHISTMIGLPATKGYYRKFIIEPINCFPEEMNKVVFKVEENYLRSQDPHKEIRLTKSGNHGSYTYTYSMRFDESDYCQQRRQITRNITGSEYMKEKNSKKIYKSVQIEKTCFVFMQRAFTVERYLQSKENLTLLRTAVPEKGSFKIEKEIPEFIKVVREITNLKEFSTLNIARRF